MLDDESEITDSLELACRTGGIKHIHKCNSAVEALQLLNTTRFSLVLLDLNMPELSGEEVLAYICRNFPELPVVIITGFDDIEKAVHCMKNGASDYLVKPVETHRLLTTVRQQLEIVQLRREVSGLNAGMLQEELCYPEAFSGIVTQNEGMMNVFRYIETIALSPRPLLVTGETGTGKELIARAYHECTQRKGELVSINVAGLDETSFSDALFGHVRGAYTGAETNRSGALLQAEGGTLFLDEIGDLSEANQIKLLRVIQENEYTPLGSDSRRSCDVRIVACTNYTIKELLDSGKLRKDFFYRISPHRVSIPPLRNRIDDVPALLKHFIKKAADVFGKEFHVATAKLETLLQNYTFPGNIREFEGMVFDAVSRSSGGKIPLEPFITHLKQFGVDNVDPILSEEADTLASENWAKSFKTLPTLKMGAQLLVKEAMERANGNQSMAATMLGITRQSLNRRLH